MCVCVCVCVCVYVCVCVREYIFSLTKCPWLNDRTPSLLRHVFVLFIFQMCAWSFNTWSKRRFFLELGSDQLLWESGSRPVKSCTAYELLPCRTTETDGGSGLLKVCSMKYKILLLRKVCLWTNLIFWYRAEYYHDTVRYRRGRRGGWNSVAAQITLLWSTGRLGPFLFPSRGAVGTGKQPVFSVVCFGPFFFQRKNVFVSFFKKNCTCEGLIHTYSTVLA